MDSCFPEPDQTHVDNMLYAIKNAKTHFKDHVNYLMNHPDYTLRGGAFYKNVPTGDVSDIRVPLFNNIMRGQLTDSDQPVEWNPLVPCPNGDCKGLGYGIYITDKNIVSIADLLLDSMPIYKDLNIASPNACVDVQGIGSSLDMTSSYTSVSEFSQNLATSVKASGTYDTVGFNMKASVSATTSFNSTKSISASIATTRLSTGVGQVAVSKNSTCTKNVDPKIIQYLRDLKFLFPQNGEDWAKYKAFFKIYGSHVVDSIRYGSIYQTFVSSETTTEEAKKAVIAQACFEASTTKPPDVVNPSECKNGIYKGKPCTAECIGGIATADGSQCTPGCVQGKDPAGKACRIPCVDGKDDYGNACTVKCYEDGTDNNGKACNASGITPDEEELQKQQAEYWTKRIAYCNIKPAAGKAANMDAPVCALVGECDIGQSGYSKEKCQRVRGTVAYHIDNTGETPYDKNIRMQTQKDWKGLLDRCYFDEWNSDLCAMVQKCEIGGSEYTSNTCNINTGREKSNPFRLMAPGGGGSICADVNYDDRNYLKTVQGRSVRFVSGGLSNLRTDLRTSNLTPGDPNIVVDPVKLAAFLNSALQSTEMMEFTTKPIWDVIADIAQTGTCEADPSTGSIFDANGDLTGTCFLEQQLRNMKMAYAANVYNCASIKAYSTDYGKVQWSCLDANGTSVWNTTLDL